MLYSLRVRTLYLMCSVISLLGLKLHLHRMLITAAAFWRPCFFFLSTLHHGLFVKDHISTDHHLVCLWIPQLETFHPFLIPQKDTLYRFCIKLRSLLTRNVHVCWASKHSQTRVVYHFASPYFLCNFTI